MSKKVLEIAIDSYITGSNPVNTIISNRLGVDDYRPDTTPYIQWELINEFIPDLSSCDIISTYQYQFRLVANNYRDLRDLVDAFKNLMEHNTCIASLRASITDENLMNVRQQLNLPLPNEDEVYKQHIMQYNFKLNKARS